MYSLHFPDHRPANENLWSPFSAVILAIIACLLIALWTGKKPTLRTYEMICFYFTGLASEEELLEHIEKLQDHS